MNEQTAIYLNQDEINMTTWALRNLHLAIDMGEIKLPLAEKQEKMDTITAALRRLKEGSGDLMAKMEAKRQAELCERAAKAYAASFAA